MLIKAVHPLFKMTGRIVAVKASPRRKNGIDVSAYLSEALLTNGASLASCRRGPVVCCARRV